MHYSGYQIETVLRQLRRLRGLLFERIPAERTDSVELSPEARERARTVRLVQPGEPVRTVVAIYDATRYPPAVERELERRAASFTVPAAEERDDGP
jgi:hypothetical protein